MADAIITLTTDFGDSSPYVAAMKGVIFGINGAARIVDLSHHIAPQDIRHAAFFLKNALPFFPPRFIHVIVIDPGVGTDRALLYVEVAGQRLLVPDNGCWTPLIGTGAGATTVVQLTEPKFWREHVSATFHGRDILAPVAAHLSLGADCRSLGAPVSRWVEFPWPAANHSENGWSAEIVFVDHFGNLITNIPAEAVRAAGVPQWRMFLGGLEVKPKWVRSYGAAARGTLVALVGSSGDLELAVTEGNAARHLQADAGTKVELRA